MFQTRSFTLLVMTLALVACGAPPQTVMNTNVSPTAAATLAPSPSPHPFAGEQVWIAYQTNRGGSEGVWLIHPDGTDDHQILTDFQGDVVLPDWSPDGKKLVMTSRNTGGTELDFVHI